MNLFLWNGIICLAFALFGELRLILIIRTNNLKKTDKKRGLHSLVEWIRLVIFSFIPLVGHTIALVSILASDEKLIEQLKELNMVEGE